VLRKGGGTKKKLAKNSGMQRDANCERYRGKFQVRGLLEGRVKHVKMFTPIKVKQSVNVQADELGLTDRIERGDYERGRGLRERTKEG
jgi:hypothetical protein